MRQDNEIILWDKDDHPSTELLRQYRNDVLPPALNHRLEEHLLDCEMCTDTMEGIMLSDATRTHAAVRHINQFVSAKTRKKRKRRSLPVYLTDWRVAAAILLVMCSTLLVLFYNYREISKEKPALASETETVIENAMDLSEEPSAATESVAEAVPDTVSPALAVTPLPVPKKPQAVASVPKQEQVTEMQDSELDIEAPVVKEEVATPVIATDIASKELIAAPAKSQRVAFQNKNTLVPDSAAGTGILEGKVAGLAIRGNAPLSKRELQGQVLSTNGEPLPGVAVRFKGTNTGVATDAAGKFTLPLPANEATLVFNYIGYNSTEKSVSPDTKNLTVNLSEDNKALSEVVVTAMSTDRSKPALIAAVPDSGYKAYKKYLEENIRYTADMEKGRVVIHATVAPTGEIQQARVSKSLCPACDQEALRLVKEGPAWKAATQNGTPIEQQVRIVVRFRSSSEN